MAKPTFARPRSVSVDEPIRVVHMLDNLERGGAAQVLVDMVLGLDKCRYAPSVCVTRPNAASPRTQALQEHGIPIMALERKHRLDLRAWKPFWDVLSDTDVLHSHSESSNMWARLMGTFKGVPVILTQEHRAPDRKLPVFKLIDRLLGPLSTRIIAVSEFDKARIAAYEKQKPEKIEVICNGIAPERFNLALSKQEARILSGLPQNGWLFVIIGRLVEEKGHEFFLAAFTELLAQTDRVAHAAVVGSGARFQELEAFVERLGIKNRVLFLGERTDIPVILKAADALISSSISECLPLVVMEALAARCPVIATDVGGVSEALKHGAAGTIIPSGDIAALVDAFQCVMECPELIRTKVDTGYAWVTTYFSRERMVTQLDALYQRLLSENSH